ncbi:hypothetical protein [Roseibacillus ishigakijimensis]|uniref:Uncharacterized protein n=1 Tax=Roseibacillus ishigakijimensis TaxID=454146 RepID=A0A934RRU7_9BACT|nr:hypothetical protein [Roseibacillus ishigakijimensis]MBK1834491.1 hypothetical protein [Roseibacillus ishigakijimensis]
MTTLSPSSGPLSSWPSRWEGATLHPTPPGDPVALLLPHLGTGSFATFRSAGREILLRQFPAHSPPLPLSLLLQREGFSLRKALPSCPDGQSFYLWTERGRYHLRETSTTDLLIAILTPVHRPPGLSS